MAAVNRWVSDAGFLAFHLISYLCFIISEFRSFFIPSDVSKIMINYKMYP